MTQSLIINQFNRFVINVIVGEVSPPGFVCIPRIEANRHVTIGWSFADGEFEDTRATYDPRRRFERAPT